MNFNPAVTAIAIIAAVFVIGIIISLWRQAHMFRGYDEYSSDAQTLASRLNAELFRDGTDLVISGNYGRLPTIIRFSYADNTPGLNVKMRAPATFTMTIVAKGGKSGEGRVVLRTPDEMFDSRFVTRTNDPMQARLIISSKPAFAQLQKLCCSSQTFLAVGSGAIELSELTIPTPYSAKHIQNHLDSMLALAEALQQMPGADSIKITPYKKEYSLIIRAALVVGVLTTIVAVVSAMYERGDTAAAKSATDQTEQIPAGITPADAHRIAALSMYRVATEADFEQEATAWARAQIGHEVSGRLPGAFSSDSAQETTYVLVQETGAAAGRKRVVLIADNDVKYDSAYPELAVAGLVPRANFSSAAWVGGTAPVPDGDGILLARKTDDPGSGTVIYLRGGRAETAVPVNYRNLGIQ